MNFLSKIYAYFQLKKYYISICCIQKDENEYLLEWIDYHRKIGVDHFYIYNNNSITPPDSILKDLIDEKIVTLIDFPGEIQQLNAYQNCLDNYGSLSKWIAFIDVDEFIVPTKTHGKLDKLLKGYENYGGLGINWLFFGSSGHKKRTHRPLVESFMMRSTEAQGVNKHIKSIVQPKHVKRPLDPHSFEYEKGWNCVNENKQIINGPFSENSTKQIQLNHYHCRSEEEYYDKIRRGRADADMTRSIQHFFDYDSFCNEVKDDKAYKFSKR